MVKFAILKFNFFWAWYGRLNLKAITGRRAGAWAPGTLNNQWLQVDFQRSTGISTHNSMLRNTQFLSGTTKKIHGYKAGAALKVRQIIPTVLRPYI